MSHPAKKELYLAELQCRSKKRSEGWAEFAEDVRLLTDKAHPQLEDAAREQLALIHYMGQLSNPQVALGVKQTRPKTLDAAVTATLETESFLPRSNAHGVSQVEEEKENLPVSGAAGETSQPSLIRALERLGERVGKLELKIESTSGRQRDPHRQGGQQPTTQPKRTKFPSWTLSKVQCTRQFPRKLLVCKTVSKLVKFSPFPGGFQE